MVRANISNYIGIHHLYDKQTIKTFSIQEIEYFTNKKVLKLESII